MIAEIPMFTARPTLRRHSMSAASIDIEWENTRVRIPVEQR